MFDHAARTGVRSESVRQLLRWTTEVGAAATCCTHQGQDIAVMRWNCSDTSLHFEGQEALHVIGLVSDAGMPRLVEEPRSVHPSTGLIPQHSSVKTDTQRTPASNPYRSDIHP